MVGAQPEGRRVVVGILGHHAGGEHQIKVAEHLPDDEERLLGHRARRPQLPGDAIRSVGAGLQSAAMRLQRRSCSESL